MTNPVILLGTQSNGETLPVQVDATGRLVAEGLQGEPGKDGTDGTDGAPGAPGPPGPPGGEFELPADPYEGAVLGWLDGGLAWVGNAPIPVPPGAFGPITDYNMTEGWVSVEGEIPAGIGTGVYIWQVDQNGDRYTQGFNTSKIWSTGLSTPNGWQNPRPVTNAFNGNLSQSADTSRTSATMTLNNLGFTEPVSVSLRATGGGDILADGVVVHSGDIADQEISFNAASMDTLVIPGNSNPYESQLMWIQVDGKYLVDPEFSQNMRVQAIAGSTLIGATAPEEGSFTVGKYLEVPAQKVAPWVLYGNDPTSLIDHLRQTRD